jgi:hypothetical protein
VLLERHLRDGFGVAVPQVPIEVIRKRGRQIAARRTKRWTTAAAAIALVSAFLLTIAFERPHAAHAPSPMASATPAPAVT